MESSPFEIIGNKLKNTAVTKQDVFANTKKVFKDFKVVLQEIIERLKNDLCEEDQRIRLKYEDRGSYDARIWVGGDVLIFHMHTNVFMFQPQNTLWQSSYLKNNPENGYCGIINVYNFLADSLSYNRVNDSGYLLSRILVNKEDHFLVQGKKIVGYDFQNFINNKLDKKEIEEVIERIILEALSFEMYIPPYQVVQTVTVNEMRKLSSNLKLKTGKRLGFKFQYEKGNEFTDL